MCLGVPGRIVSIQETDPETRSAEVVFGALRKSVSLAFTPDAQVGDYVVVHVGFAISRIDEQEAKRVFEWVRQMELP